jgi:hypothetical protein
MLVVTRIVGVSLQQVLRAVQDRTEVMPQTVAFAALRLLIT